MDMDTTPITRAEHEEFDISNDSTINVNTSGNSVQNGNPAHGNVSVNFTYTIVLHN